MFSRNFLHVIALILAFTCTRDARAQQHEEPWLVVPAVSGAAPSQVAATTAAALELEESLQNVSAAVLPNVLAAQRFEKQQPAPSPIEVGTQQDLIGDLRKGQRLLELGHLSEAETALLPIERLDESDLDWLRRSDARLMFEVCVTHARILRRENQTRRARDQMVRCVATYPGFTPRDQPEIRQLFDEAQSSLSFGTLEVRGPASCTVRVFGVAVGRSPLTVRLIARPTPLQLECSEDSLGRRHLVNVGTRSAVDIDPRFDHVVHSSDGLELVYEQQDSLRSDLANDADALGRALNARVILLEPNSASAYSVTAAALTPRDLGTLHYDSRSGAARADLLRILGVLRRASEPDNSGLQPRASSGAGESKPDVVVPPASSSAAEGGKSLARPIVGTALGVLGVGGLVTSWALYADRQNFRLEPRPLITYDVLDAFNRRGAWMLGVAGFADAAAIAAEYLLLPASDAVPLAAWLVGAAGIAGTAVGIAYTVGGDACDPMAVGSGVSIPRACYSRLSDGLFGPMLVLSSVPLLNVPLVYLLRSWLGTPEHALTLTPTGLNFRGRF